MINTSTLIKLWNGSSIADITRSIEADERSAYGTVCTKCGAGKRAVSKLYDFTLRIFFKGFPKYFYYSYIAKPI